MTLMLALGRWYGFTRKSLAYEIMKDQYRTSVNWCGWAHGINVMM